MLEHVPAWLGKVLKNVRAGHGKLAIVRLGSEDKLGHGNFTLSSPAFKDGEAIDPCFTADEEDAVAPPVEWTAAPDGAVELALIVEDPDAPMPEPLCHWLVWGLPPHKGKILEGEIPALVGKNSYGNSEWLLPDPPTGHGPHDYVFQLFALDTSLDLMPGATRSDLVEAIDGHVVASAVLTGRYARAEDDFFDEDDTDRDD